MAKKGGKKKGKKGGKGKKTAKNENQMTLNEAMLAFQIQIKEKTAEDLRVEIAGLREKNKRFKNRNEQLKEEQLIHIKTLLKQAKNQKKELEQQEVFNSEHVEQALRDKWDAAKKEEKSLDELRVNIAEVDKQYASLNEKLEFWTVYRDEGSLEHKEQIELLENELENMKSNFNGICDHLKWQLDTSKSEVTAHTEMCMAEQKHLASERAMSLLDGASVREVHENEWLKNEAELYRKEEKELLNLLDRLERENLNIISTLLDCKQEDLKIPRRFYLTQFTDDDVLTDDTMHNMDLKQMSVYQENYKSLTESTPQEERPKSAMLKAVEDKVFSITLPEEDSNDSEDEMDGDVEADMIAHQDEDINLEDDEDFLHLGPLEITLLCVFGEKKPIHKMDARLEIKDGTRADITVTRPRWPIQTPMIKAAVASAETMLASSAKSPDCQNIA